MNLDPKKLSTKGLYIYYLSSGFMILYMIPFLIGVCISIPIEYTVRDFKNIVLFGLISFITLAFPRLTKL